MNLFDTAFRALKTMAAVSSKAGDTSESTTNHANASPPVPEPPIRKTDISAGIPHYNKGMILERRGDKVGAIKHYQDAVQVAPDYFDAHANLARLFCQQERWEAALSHCRVALQLQPNSPRVHNNLAAVLYQKGQVADAIRHCTVALGLAPDDMEVFDNLTDIRKNHPELDSTEAVHDARVLCTQLADTNYTRGFELLKDGKTAEAIERWRRAIRFDPEWAALLSSLAWILATHPDDKIRNGKEAMDLALRALRFGGEQSPPVMDAVAAAYAECGRFAEARRTMEKILPVVKAKGPLELAETMPQRLKMYSMCKPWRDTFGKVRPVKR